MGADPTTTERSRIPRRALIVLVVVATVLAYRHASGAIEKAREIEAELVVGAPYANVAALLGHDDLPSVAGLHAVTQTVHNTSRVFGWPISRWRAEVEDGVIVEVELLD